jgi:homoisocitrate dehydrogenase
VPRLCVIAGDGIGQEVVPAALSVLQAVVPDLEIEHAQAGWGTFQETGDSLPQTTIETARRCKAVLFGAVASPSYRVDGYRSTILSLRKALDTFANLRPTRSGPGAPPNIDLLIVRENSEGLYIGKERATVDGAVAERLITRAGSERIAVAAFEAARRDGRRRITVIHKANILPLSDGLFRDSARKVGSDYPEIEVDELLVDAAAYWLARDPARFDVLLAPNLYGDILSDLAAAWSGGLGVAPSLSLGTEAALAEPVHGAAPDIAGQGIANPAGAMLSTAMLARYWWDRPEVAEKIERALERAFADGFHTPDLVLANEAVNTSEFTSSVLERL